MSDKIKTNIDTFHEHGLFLPRRSVEIFGDIDIDQFQKVFRNLHALDYIQGDITILINSPGGCVTQAKAIFDAIKGCRNKVRGFVIGEASSAASIILQACDERLIAPNAYIMIHIGTESSVEDVHPEIKRNWDEHNKQDEEWMEDVYLSRIKEKKKKFTRNQLKSLLRFDTILKSDKAIELGLADRIEESLI